MGSQTDSLVRTPFSEIMATLEVLAQHGVGQGDLTRIRSDPRHAAAVAGEMQRFHGNVVQSFAQLLDACRQDSVHGDFTEKNFPMVNDWAGNLPAEEYGFDREVIDNEVVAELAKIGYKPVGIHRAMKWIAAHQDAQLAHPIAVIGARWKDRQGHVNFPVFLRVGSERVLGLEQFNGVKFGVGVHFLVVRDPGFSAA